MPHTIRSTAIPGSADMSHALFAGTAHTRPVVLACVDRSRHGRRVLAHAGALAAAMDGELVLMRVLDPHSGDDLPPDPVDWEVRRREAGAALARLAERGGVEAEIVLAQGRPAEEIFHVADRLKADVIVLGRYGEDVEDEERAARIGGTARAILERAHEKVLLVPENDQQTHGFRRILVPLDGSCWAESALPTAVRLARSTGAEIVLAQIVTPPEFVCPTPPEPDDTDLRARVMERNDRAARKYLERLRGLLAEQGIIVCTRVVAGTDARDRLLELLREDAFELVVLSSRGSGFRHLPGHHYGSVAAHLSFHSETPLLVVRPETKSSHRHSRRRAAALAPQSAALLA
ncbi:MAG: universal stress protein [Pararhodobacter sp.]|nr:universal stress protein [Pararhodobacter sp.]